MRRFMNTLRRLNTQEWTIREYVYAVILILIVGDIGWALVDQAALTQRAIAFPFPLEYVEGPNLDRLTRMPDLASLYPARFDAPPYVATPEPPGFLLAQWPLAELRGVSFAVGRTVSVISAVVAALLIMLIVRALSKDWAGAILAGSALLLTPHLSQVSLIGGPDTLGFALSLAGIYAALRVRRPPLAVALAVVCFVAAAFTAPLQVLPALAAAAAHFAQKRSWRQVALLLLGFAGLSLVVYVLLEAATGGGFSANVFAALGRAFSRDRWLGYVINIVVRSGMLMIVIVLFFFVERLGDGSSATPVAATYFIGALLNSVTSGLSGATLGAVYPLAGAICLAGGVAIAWMSFNLWLKSLAVIGLLLQINTFIDWTQVIYQPLLSRRFGGARETAILARRIGAQSGPVLTDEHLGFQTLNGRRPYLYPLEFNQLHGQGLWSDAQLVEAIRRKEFALVLWYEPQGSAGGDALIVTRWPLAVRNAVYDNYRQSEIFADTIVYVPKP